MVKQIESAMTDNKKISVPKGAVDCHMHIYGPSDKYAPATNNGLCSRAHFSDYIKLRNALGLSRTVYVQPSHYQRDNSCMLDAMAADPSQARGIAVIGTEANKAEFIHLDNAGIRGARFSLLFSGCLSLEELEPVADRIAEFGWHVQVQLDGSELPDLEQRLRLLPVPFVIDHLGRIPVTSKNNSAAHSALFRLLDTGKCWVKLSAPYHVSMDPSGNCADIKPLAQHLITAYPDRLVWGSNWPHPNAISNPPDDQNLLRLLFSWCDNANQTEQILVTNPEILYGFAKCA